MAFECNPGDTIEVSELIEYIDTKVPLDGSGEMTGALDMGLKRIHNASFVQVGSELSFTMITPVNIELGGNNSNTVAELTYIDFHASEFNSHDYDARIIVENSGIDEPTNTGDMKISARDIVLRPTNGGIASVDGKKILTEGDALSGTYTNKTPTPIDHGGIPAGSTFTDVPLTEMWDKELYPYQSPAFIAFDLDEIGTNIEVGGKIVSGSHGFSWDTSNDENIVNDSLIISDVTNDVILEEDIQNDGLEVVMFPEDIVHTLESSHTWKITAINSNEDLLFRETTVKWLWRSFWGNDIDGDVTESDIKAGSSRLDADGNGDYSVGAESNVYKFIAYPKEHGEAGRIIDKNTGFDVAMDAAWNPATIAITNSKGIDVDMYVYRTMNRTSGALIMTVTGTTVGASPMTGIPGTVPLTGIIAPLDDADKYPVTDDKYNKGGYRTVVNEADRDAIPQEKRKHGMLVYVSDLDVRFRLDGNLTSWTPDLNGGLYPVGMFEPVSGNEYPDTTGIDIGGYWGMENLDSEGYTFEGGDLIGKTLYEGDAMIHGSVEWGYLNLNIDPDIYYRVDGTKQIIAPFAGGAQVFKDAANAVDAQDLTTLSQVEAKLEIGVYNRPSRYKSNRNKG